MDKDIERLLADDESEEEEKDLKPEEKPAEQEKSPAEKVEESSNEKKLKRELRKRQEEIDRLKAEKEKPKEEVPADELATREGWLKHIDETADKKAEEKLKPIFEANRNRAIRQFIERHPDYATGENKSKLKEVVSAADGKVEEGEILESMSRAWASQNYQELERAAARRDQARSSAQKSAIKASSVGEGVRNEDDFTEAETAKAEKLGMTVEEYRKALAGYRATSVNTVG